MPSIDAERLSDFVAQIFIRLGSSPEEGARIGRYLVNANLTGHDSHGVARVPRYVQWRRDGLLFADRVVERVVDNPVIAILDGQFGFGQTMAPQAVALGIEKCRAHGLSAIGLRNSGHVGRVGEWAEMAAEAGLVSVHFVNVAGSVLVAPFGGVERRFSTAPVCIGMPHPGGLPVILDFATSLVAEGKVLVASQGGKKLPADALVSAEGKLSGDPRELYGEYGPGPARDHKKGQRRAARLRRSQGLGARADVRIARRRADRQRRLQSGQALVAGHVLVLCRSAEDRPGAFSARRIVALPCLCERARGRSMQNAPVLLPGEPEARLRAERTENGVPLTEETLAGLIATARSVGLDGSPV